MKECKGRCSSFCCDNDNVNFGKSPGRCKTCNKHCTVCEYWILTSENKCDCCHNLLKLRKNYNVIDVIYDLLFPSPLKLKQQKQLRKKQEEDLYQTKLLLLQEITTK